MQAQISLHQQMVEITSRLLGPASERFIDRQIHNHVHKDPEDITKDDVAALIDWIKISLALLTEDMTTVNSFVNELNALTKK